ncbi:MAG: hypothetical protein DWQ07_17655 [Chloroflexi bacterium]|nr:MAG: hypothetical protein DWQ07_17655 [Chloroflexota bacterium]
MTEVMIRLAEHLPAPELTVVDDGGARRTHFVDEWGLLQVLRTALQEHVVQGQHYFPPELLGGDLVNCSVWWRPPAPQIVTVEVEKRKQRMLTIPLPGLVLGIGKSSLRLVAVKGQDRPEFDGELFLAPFPNIGTGSVCMGSGDKVNSEMVLNPEAAWEALWSSAFTDHSISGQSRKYPYDVRELLFELDGQASFPQDDLVPIDTCLEDFIRE